MLKTKRLLLRQWTEEDFPPLAKMCADKDVMAFFPKLLTREQSFDMGNRAMSLIQEHGWGAWVVELPGQQKFIGFVGLHISDGNLPCSPCVEILWRLEKQHWGKGYAVEAALAALNYAFCELQLKELVSFTALGNVRSQTVMKNIGMHNTRHNFMHPDVEPNHPLCEHVLYKISRDQWLETNA